MATKQAAKNELQKLKTLTDTTEVWSRRVHKFWKSTADICQCASESCCLETSAVSVLQSQLTEFSEGVCKCVENVKDVAQNRYVELNKKLQEKAKSKQKDICCTEISRRVGDASVEISAAIFSTFRTQADHLDQLTQAVMELQRQQLEAKASANVAATGVSRDSLELKKREISSDENNIELDWDAFDRDLAACSDVVDKMGHPQSARESESEEVQKLKKQLRQAQRESGELMKRAILAEHALGSVEKHNSELQTQVDTGYNQDDFMEVRKALQKEQLARLDLEQRLRDAQEEIKAAQFAFTVAKAVANRIADSAEISQGGIARCQSEKQIGDRAPQIVNSVSADASQISESSVDASTPDVSVAVGRTDSAFFGEKEEEEEEPVDALNPFVTDVPESEEETTMLPPVPSEALESHSSNPFLSGTAEETRMSLEEDTSNPFLSVEAESCPQTLPNDDRHSHGSSDRFEEESNPFLMSKSSPADVAVSDRSSAAEWNPFAASSSSTNPFLT